MALCPCVHTGGPEPTSHPAYRSLQGSMVCPTPVTVVARQNCCLLVPGDPGRLQNVYQEKRMQGVTTERKPEPSVLLNNAESSRKMEVSGKEDHMQ